MKLYSLIHQRIFWLVCRIIQLLLCLGCLLVLTCLILVKFLTVLFHKLFCLFDFYLMFKFCRFFFFFFLGGGPVPIENLHEKEKGDTKDHPHSQWFMNFSEADELLKLAAARQQVRISWFISALFCCIILTSL